MDEKIMLPCYIPRQIWKGFVYRLWVNDNSLGLTPHIYLFVNGAPARDCRNTAAAAAAAAAIFEMMLFYKNLGFI